MPTQKHRRIFRHFTLHLTYSQFWLNMGYRQSGYIMNWSGKTRSPSTTTSSIVASAICTRLVSFFERGNPSPSCFLWESICFLNFFSFSPVSVLVHLWVGFFWSSGARGPSLICALHTAAESFVSVFKVWFLFLHRCAEKNIIYVSS